MTSLRNVRTALAGILIVAASTVALAQTPTWPREPEHPSAPKPKAPPQEWLDLIGEYDGPDGYVYVIERGGALCLIVDRGEAGAIDGMAPKPVFTRDATGRATRLSIGSATYVRQHVGPETGSGQLRVTPLRPVTELLREALNAAPPQETGTFRPSDLVEVVTLDPTIKLDIRYATTNNFLGSVFYPEARAFLQRPAAEALVRAQGALKPLGYGLLVHDGYRPWYVTKTFWDATPQDKKWLVANPTLGSRHNRGAAVDLTLYALDTAEAVEMPSTYDESTPRAYAFYPGGTSLQRWHRALLRRLMEAEGFTVNPEEWWHFDYNDWRSYAIGNVTFDKIR